MDILPAVGAVLSGVFAIVIGYFVGRRDNAATPSVPTIAQQAECSGACAQLEAARQASCLAEAAVTAATNRVGSLNSQVNTAWAVAGFLWAGVIAAYLIPLVGYIAAAAIAAVASAATAFALYLAGMLVEAQQDQGAKQSAATAALQAVIDARNVVLAVCKGQDQIDCLNRPSPCA